MIQTSIQNKLISTAKQSNSALLHIKGYSVLQVLQFQSTTQIT